jgi:hypothetical protein
MRKIIAFAFPDDPRERHKMSDGRASPGCVKMDRRGKEEERERRRSQQAEEREQRRLAMEATWQKRRAEKQA